MKKRKIKKTTILCITLDLLALICLLVVYGPFPQFKNWWITTSLATGDHKWFANIFYSDNTIQKVLTKNTIIESKQSTDINKITFNSSKQDTYESIYEEQILDRNENDLYKLIKIDEKDYSGYLVVIYDSKRISLETSSKIKFGGQTTLELAEEKEAIVAINASGFARVNGGLLPTGTVIKDGKIYSIGRRNTHGGGLIGFTKNGVLMLTTDSAEKAIKNGMNDAMTFGPFLIVNGKSAEVKGNGGWGVANRTAIAQRKDGIVLFLVIDGRGADGSNGISILDMIKLFERYGAYNAANLDGGGSSTLVIENKIINDPRGYGYTGARYLPNAWTLK